MRAAVILGAGVGVLAGIAAFGHAGAEAGRPLPRLVVLAVDGGGDAQIREFLREGALPNFARLRDEGALADGMAPAFPSKTAASFAMIWTGRPGRETGITGNSVLAVPPAAHSLLDTRDGFSARQLRAEPLWTRLSRAGLTAVAIHTTHTYPLEAALEGLDRDARERLFVLTGYAGVREPAETLTAEDHPLANPPVAGAAGLGDAGGVFRFGVGESRFLGVFLDDRGDPRSGWDTFAVLDDPRRDDGADAEADPLLFLARVAVGAAGNFSVPIAASVEGRRVDFRVRAFLAEPGTAEVPARFVVHRSAAHEVAAHPAEAWEARLGSPSWPAAAGAAAYARGSLGPPRFREGDGRAEARLVEIAGATADAAVEHLAAAATIPDWRFIGLYIPTADEFGHLLYGYLDERLPGHDPDLAALLRPILRDAFREVDRVLGRVFRLAEERGAHVLVVSDHGMAGTNRLVHVNVALERAGLLAFGPDGLPDLSRTRAMLLTTADGSIAVNRDLRPGGIVPPGEEADALAAVRRAVLGIRDASGEPVVTGFVRPDDRGSIPIGGATTGDLFLRLRPGFVPSARPAAAVIMPARPSGNHGFFPLRPDMRAMVGGWGPRLLPGTRWPRASALDVVPTALDLLDLPADPDLPGRSLLGSVPLATPTGASGPER